MRRTVRRVVLLGTMGALLGGACGGMGSRQARYAPSMTVAREAMGPTEMEMPPPDAPNTESYARIDENAFHSTARSPLSTFSIDVDTASYANVRSFLIQNGRLPPVDAVRIEELINYFPYSDPAPSGNDPLSLRIEVADCPWAPGHRLARIGMKGREIAVENRPASNLVFLIDVSGSMSDENKLPLLKRAFSLLTSRLRPSDRVSMVVYAGSSGLVLPPTAGDRKAEILGALERLSAGGSTNGGRGIELAYRVAQDGFIPGGTNRVILATDGDFNVGVTSEGGLTRLIEEKAKSGVYLTVLGFGMGNYKDSTMEKLADKGNGNYAYIDTIREAEKVFIEQMAGTLITIAKDVKLQVEWNPSEVESYRLIGYENRILRHEDFNDDKKDAGDVGAGHTVTALYEFVPKGVAGPQTQSTGSVDPLKYQQAPVVSAAARGGEVMTVKLRWQPPEGGASTLRALPVKDGGAALAAASEDLRFATAVAGFGMLLRDSPHLHTRGALRFGDVLAIGGAALGRDPGGHRREFLDLVRRAAELKGERMTALAR